MWQTRLYTKKFLTNCNAKLLREVQGVLNFIVDSYEVVMKPNYKSSNILNWSVYDVRCKLYSQVELMILTCKCTARSLTNEIVSPSVGGPSVSTSMDVARSVDCKFIILYL